MSSYAYGYRGGYGPFAAVPDPSPPPIPPAGPPAATPNVWVFALGAHTGLPTGELSDASNRSVTWRLTGSSEASLNIDGNSAQAADIDELIDDLWVLWNGIPLYRGRFGASSDAGSDSGVSTTFGSADYRELLQRRFLYEGDTLSYLQADQADIAWGLIQSTQTDVGGNLGIVRGATTTTGVVRDRSDYAAGDSVGNALDLLSQVTDGFDYDFTPSLTSNQMTFDIFYPARGAAKNVVLDYGGRVASFTRTVDPSAFGNAVRASGADTLTPIRKESATLATDPAGRWDLQYADTSITVASTLRSKATSALAAGQYVQPSWTVTLKPGGWAGPSDFWLGDQVTLSVKAGRLDVDESLRVVEISLAIDENDVDVMTVTLGSPNPKLKRTQRAVDKRLSALERR